MQPAPQQTAPQPQYYPPQVAPQYQPPGPYPHPGWYPPQPARTNPLVYIMLIAMAVLITYLVLERRGGGSTPDSKPEPPVSRYTSLISPMMTGDISVEATYLRKVMTATAGMIEADGKSPNKSINRRQELVAVISKAGHFSVVGNEISQDPRFATLPNVMSTITKEILPPNEKGEVLDGDLTDADRAKAVTTLRDLAAAFEKFQ